MIFPLIVLKSCSCTFDHQQINLPSANTHQWPLQKILDPSCLYLFLYFWHLFDKLFSRVIWQKFDTQSISPPTIFRIEFFIHISIFSSILIYKSMFSKFSIHIHSCMVSAPPDSIVSRNVFEIRWKLQQCSHRIGIVERGQNIWQPNTRIMEPNTGIMRSTRSALGNIEHGILRSLRSVERLRDTGVF